MEKRTQHTLRVLERDHGLLLEGIEHGGEEQLADEGGDGLRPQPELEECGERHLHATWVPLGPLAHNQVAHTSKQR